MKRIMMLLAITLMAFMFTGCNKVPAGNVGVKVYLLGASKGVDHEVLGVGRYWIGVNEDLYLFPTYTQNYNWSRAGERGDESITFQTSEGLEVNGDFGISYHIDPNKVALIFQKYRKGVDEITDIYLRNMVRDSLVKRGSNLSVESVYGKGKTDLIEQVQKDVEDQVSGIGIVVEKLYMNGGLRLPNSVTDALNAKISATQKAQQRENEVAQAKAEADKAIATARGEAESKLAIAKADAEAMRIKGEALRSNPELMQLASIEKWNGVLPVVTGGGSMPLIDVKALTGGTKKE